MSFKIFNHKMNTLSRRAGAKVSVHSPSTGVFKAVFEDGTIVTGSLGSAKVMVQWGGTPRNHKAIAEV